jgi:aryl-alcohol dehydrogenase-like predicted oxidoreductase
MIVEDEDRHQRLGLGAMRLSTEGRPHQEQAEQLIRVAVESGLRLIDTADSYHLPIEESPGHNETLIARALNRWGLQSEVDVATKGGHLRNDHARDGWALCGHPEFIRAAAIASLRRLGRDSLFLYQLHRPDPLIPFGDSVGALAKLKSDGLVQRVGLSNVSFDDLTIAHSILGDDLYSVQNAHSLWRPLGEDIVTFCKREGIQLLVRSPFGGEVGSAALKSDPTVAEIAFRLGVSSHVIALAWVLRTLPGAIALIGATQTRSWLDALHVSTLHLEASDVDALSSLTSGS